MFVQQYKQIQQGCGPRNMNLCDHTLHHKMYNRQPQVIGKTFENLEIPGKPKELLVYVSKV